MTNDDLIISDKCSHCENRQKTSYGQRLCDYGIQAVPITSVRHPSGICGPEAKLFSPRKRYAEFGDV